MTNDLLLYVITQRDLLSKNKELDDLNDKTHEHIRSLVKEKGDAKLWKIFVDTQSILYDKLADNKKTDSVKALDHQESKLNQIAANLRQHRIIKYSATIVVFFLMILLSQSTIIQLINITVSSSQADLKESIDQIIPNDMKIDSALT